MLASRFIRSWDTKYYFLTCFHLTCILLLLFVAILRARLLKLNPLLMPLHIVTERNASDTRLGAALKHLSNNIAADYASCLRWARGTEDVGRQSLSRTLLLHPSGRTHKCRHFSFHLNVNWSLLTWWGWKTSPDCRSRAPAHCWGFQACRTESTGKGRCLFNSATSILHLFNWDAAELSYNKCSTRWRRRASFHLCAQVQRSKTRWSKEVNEWRWCWPRFRQNSYTWIGSRLTVPFGRTVRWNYNYCIGLWKSATGQPLVFNLLSKGQAGITERTRGDRFTFRGVLTSQKWRANGFKALSCRRHVPERRKNRCASGGGTADLCSTGD